MMSEEKILTQEIAAQFLEDLEDQDWVDLNEFTSIEDAAAKILGKWESGRVVLLSLSLKSHPSSLGPQASFPHPSGLRPQAYCRARCCRQPGVAFRIERYEMHLSIHRFVCRPVDAFSARRHCSDQHHTGPCRLANLSA